jgi:hypothetical protein
MIVSMKSYLSNHNYTISHECIEAYKWYLTIPHIRDVLSFWNGNFFLRDCLEQKLWLHLRPFSIYIRNSMARAETAWLAFRNGTSCYSDILKIGVPNKSACLRILSKLTTNSLSPSLCTPRSQSKGSIDCTHHYKIIATEPLHSKTRNIFRISHKLLFSS